MSLMHDTERDSTASARYAGNAPGDPADAARLWSLVIPVKATQRAKTRVVTEPEGLIDNAALAAAFAYDTVEAALSSEQVQAVYVVTEDLQIAAGVRELGAIVVVEQSKLPIESPGFARLNDAIHSGELAARDAGAKYVAALTADLPTLTPAELSAVLVDAARFARSYVADSSRIGTSLLAAGPETALDPQFGYDSAAAHAATGAVSIDVSAPTVRTDVDTLDELSEAADLGLGPRTAALFAEYEQRAANESTR